MYHATPFWTVKFLQKYQLIAFQGIPLHMKEERENPFVFLLLSLDFPVFCSFNYDVSYVGLFGFIFLWLCVLPVPEYLFPSSGLGIFQP